MQTVSKSQLWTGRILSGLVALFLLMDGVGKVVKAGPVVEGSGQLGYPESTVLPLTLMLWAGLALRSPRLRAVLFTPEPRPGVAEEAHRGIPTREAVAR